MDFLNLRRSIIKKYFNRMNDRQFDAVTTVNGPLLVLAGAGSGKTTVLVNRILNLIKFGDAYNSNYIPSYTDDDIKKLLDLAEKNGAKLITTEKDWVRLPENVRDKIKYAHLDTKLDGDFWNWLKEKLK